MPLSNIQIIKARCCIIHYYILWIWIAFCTLNPFLHYFSLHYSHPIHRVTYACILHVYYVVLIMRTYMFCLLICLHQGSERNIISIPSMSCTYGRIDHKVDFDYIVLNCPLFSVGRKQSRPLEQWEGETCADNWQVGLNKDVYFAESMIEEMKPHCVGHLTQLHNFVISWLRGQVAAGVQVRLHQPAVSAGRQDLSQRCRHHLSRRVWVSTQIPEQVRLHIQVCQNEIIFMSWVRLQPCKGQCIISEILQLWLCISWKQSMFGIVGNVIVVYIAKWKVIENPLICITYRNVKTRMALIRTYTSAKAQSTCSKNTHLHESIP